jgi:hypothetical protein
MKISVDIWLRGTDFASTESFDTVVREPKAWEDDDVRALLEGMLVSMHKAKLKGVPEQPIALRGISWIVNPYEDGGVVVALEITMGAAVSGPFEIEKEHLEAMISRVLVRPAPPQSVH